MQLLLAKWGFVIAGLVFFFVALAPLVTSGTLNVTVFVLAIVFLVLGAAIARKSASGSPPVR